MLYINDWMLGVIAFVYGTIFSSFLTLVAYRVPAGISIVKPASHCDNCKHTLRIIDLIPIFSYLLTRGKCRYCGIAYGNAHLFYEISLGVAFGLSGFFLFGKWLMLGTLLLFLCFVNVEMVMTGIYQTLGKNTKRVGYLICSLLAIGIFITYSISLTDGLFHLMLVSMYVYCLAMDRKGQLLIARMLAVFLLLVCLLFP